MLLFILLVFGSVMGLGTVLHIYYDIKHMEERERLDAEEAKARLTRKFYL